MKTIYSLLFILTLSTLAHAQQDDSVNVSDCTVEGQKYLNIVVDQIEKKNKGDCTQKITYNSLRKLTALVNCNDEKGAPLATGFIRLRCGADGISVFESKFTAK